MREFGRIWERHIGDLEGLSVLDLDGNGTKTSLAMGLYYLEERDERLALNSWPGA
jgi:hypothetical protein